MRKLSNITIKEFRELLTKLGLQFLRTAGGLNHCNWLGISFRESLK